MPIIIPLKLEVQLMASVALSHSSKPLLGIVDWADAEINITINDNEIRIFFILNNFND
jgi:hypothetical protein